MIIDNITPEPKTLAIIEKFADKLDTNMAQFTSEVSRSMLDEEVYIKGSRTIAAFIEQYTNIEGVNALYKFLEELTDTSKVLKWNTLQDAIQAKVKSHYRLFASNLEDFVQIAEDGFDKVYGSQNYNYDHIFDFQVKGTLKGNIAGISCIHRRTIAELQKSNIEWFIPIVKNSDAKGFDLIDDKFGKWPITWGLTNYASIDEDLTLHLQKPSGLNEDVAPSGLYVSVKHIAPEYADKTKVSQWLPKDIILLLGYPILDY